MTVEAEPILKEQKHPKKEAEESSSPLTIFYFLFYLDQNLFLYEVTNPTSYIKILVNKKIQKNGPSQDSPSGEDWGI